MGVTREMAGMLSVWAEEEAEEEIRDESHVIGWPRESKNQ